MWSRGTRFTRRVVAAFERLADLHPHEHERVVVVAHDAVNQALLLALFPDRWPDHNAISQRNGCWNRLERVASSAWALLVFDAIPGDDHRP